VVGVVPPVKPAAALTRTGVIGLLATPATAQRTYTTDLIARFAAGKRVVRFGSAALVEAAERKLRGESGGFESAITEALDGLFGAPGGGEIDVVALACTHFPLLGAELAAAAPRACVWMDSGEAIARRVAHLLIADEGRAHARRAGFTNANSARALFRAFSARGFETFAEIAEAPRFEASPIADVQSA
jgi:glutamate racemase